MNEIPFAVRRLFEFQQGIAPPHFAGEVRKLLKEVLPGRWIGHEGPIQWPPRYPDLTRLDFCPLGSSEVTCVPY
ncbi:hypothetical protein Cfor_09377 [Coptotermes formosanus]|uniref:Uncharacterized protein n=1 Tax=Coptotermes formosanus TaxID=36987 RepID=A0A6L2PVI3_COPFO|nr:hypothetical protein Cfor_09377 [Coptotermes formosanus]